MKNKAYDLRTYTFSLGEKVLVDANVWLYLYPPPMKTDAPFAWHYSKAFAKMIDKGCCPVIDPLIISEYLNSYCRIEWAAQFKMDFPTFKKFRKSSHFSRVAETAAFFAKKILNSCSAHDTPANTLDMHQAIVDFESANVDFNDALLTDICKKHNFKLLTNDGDFRLGGIEVLTTNPRLLHG